MAQKYPLETWVPVEGGGSSKDRREYVCDEGDVSVVCV